MRMRLAMFSGALVNVAKRAKRAFPDAAAANVADALDWLLGRVADAADPDPAALSRR